MKLSELIGKKVNIVNFQEDDDYYYEFELGLKYDRTYWDTESGDYVGTVVDISVGRETCIVVSSGEYLWDFADTEITYEGRRISEVVKEWDYKNCKSIAKKDDKWGIDIGGE